MTIDPDRAPQVHRFTSGEMAYNCSQCDDDIRDGDILIVEPREPQMFTNYSGETSEVAPARPAAVAILCGAWPVAVTLADGEAFHVAGDGWDWRNFESYPGNPEVRDYTRSVVVAVREARTLGAEVHPLAASVADSDDSDPDPNGNGPAGDTIERDEDRDDNRPGDMSPADEGLADGMAGSVAASNSATARQAFRVTFRGMRAAQKAPTHSVELPPMPDVPGAPQAGKHAPGAVSPLAKLIYTAAIRATFGKASRAFGVEASRTAPDPHRFASAIRANLESARYRRRTGYARGVWRRMIALHPGGMAGSSALAFPDYGEFDRPMIAPATPAVAWHGVTRPGPFSSAATAAR